MLLNILQYPFEALFRSLHYALLDNACLEYLFISDFFMVSASAALDFFNLIFGKTITIFAVRSSSDFNFIFYYILNKTLSVYVIIECRQC